MRTRWSGIALIAVLAQALLWAGVRFCGVRDALGIVCLFLAYQAASIVCWEILRGRRVQRAVAHEKLWRSASDPIWSPPPEGG